MKWKDESLNFVFCGCITITNGDETIHNYCLKHQIDIMLRENREYQDDKHQECNSRLG